MSQADASLYKVVSSVGINSNQVPQRFCVNKAQKRTILTPLLPLSSFVVGTALLRESCSCTTREVWFHSPDNSFYFPGDFCWRAF